MNPINYSMSQWKKIVAQSHAVREITDTIRYAKLCNKYLLKWTEGRNSLLVNADPSPTLDEYEFFQFNVNKWSKVAEELIATNTHIGKITHSPIAQECTLDLVKALAEYNIPAGIFSVPSMKTFLKCFVDDLTAKKRIDPRLRKIFTQAQVSLKGDGDVLRRRLESLEDSHQSLASALAKKPKSFSLTG